MQALYINIIFVRHSCQYEQATSRLSDRLLVSETLCIFPYSEAIRIENALENAIHARQTAPARVSQRIRGPFACVRKDSRTPFYYL